jgi:hypothetical protein
MAAKLRAVQRRHRPVGKTEDRDTPTLAARQLHAPVRGRHSPRVLVA